MRRTAARVALLVALVLSLLAAPAAADAGHPVFPESGSPVQDELTGLFHLVGWMSVGTAVIVLAVLTYAILKFRGDPLVKKKGRWFTHNNKLEITWTVLTALVLVFLGVVTAQSMDRIETAPEDPGGPGTIDVVAIGQQWQWQFVYPDGNVTEDDLHVEAGRTVQLHIVSCDVIHSLYIPNLGVKIDTTVLAPEQCEVIRQTGSIPDGVKVSRFWIEPDEGRYRLQCAEYCGTGHAFMEGEVIAFTPGSRDKPYGAPPDLGQVVHLEIGEEGGQPTLSPSEIGLTAGDLTTWIVHNNGTANHELAIGGAYNISTGTIPPGEQVQKRFTASTAGTFDVTVDGRDLAGLQVTAGQIEHVELSDSPWYVRDGGQFEPGKTYAIKVWNNGSTGHNLYIGDFAQNRDQREAIFTTETFPADESRWLNVTMPEEPTRLEWWCDVPGHAELGMLDDITVGEPTGTEDDGQIGTGPLLPGLEVLGALAGLGAAAWIVRRS